MLVLADPAHRDHNPDPDRGYPEIPGRVAAIREALSATGLAIEEHHGEAQDVLRNIHPPEMFVYLEAFSAAVPEAATRYPEIHRTSALPDPARMGRPPGFTHGYCFDQTPLTTGTTRAALAAANLAIEGAERLLGGIHRVYCLCRPPGHHAGSDFFGGFCYLNNAALAAQRLSREGKVAILDIDYHHGNGTQEIFYARDDVFYSSIHAHPGYAYPGFSGYAEETGFGAGAGHNHNRPLGPGSGDNELLPELDGALEHIAAFQPAFLVVSLGTDIASGDPIADWRVSTRGFGRAGQMIAQTGLPTVMIQEGGYSLTRIGGDVTAFLEGFG
ncbi:MAG: histone deacetylase family protein [Chloroflexota bacterium]|jgi:acetoin utilization deacetylase AcuC-like enzyme|nr:histone deacetylase family protein [Chloroflexota bacterium]MDP6756665.1 histone deacetylase family protein [Chloroflexota bacterium]